MCVRRQRDCVFQRLHDKHRLAAGLPPLFDRRSANGGGLHQHHVAMPAFAPDFRIVASREKAVAHAFDMLFGRQVFVKTTDKRFPGFLGNFNQPTAGEQYEARDKRRVI